MIWLSQRLQVPVWISVCMIKGGGETGGGGGRGEPDPGCGVRRTERYEGENWDNKGNSGKGKVRCIL